MSTLFSTLDKSSLCEGLDLLLGTSADASFSVGGHPYTVVRTIADDKTAYHLFFYSVKFLKVVSPYEHLNVQYEPFYSSNINTLLSILLMEILDHTGHRVLRYDDSFISYITDGSVFMNQASLYLRSLGGATT